MPLRTQIIKIRRGRMREEDDDGDDDEEEEEEGEEYVRSVIMFMLSHAPSHSVQTT
jgi:uncharacterized protein YgfB (UPF0149 family)